MKCIININENCNEEVHIFARKRTRLVDEIVNLAESGSKELTGYSESEAYILSLSEIYCFAVENNKTYALTADKKLWIKLRLYQLEEMSDERFIKINQSCIVNINHIMKFDVAFSGMLNVKLKNGYTDYVSRRNVKAVKERLGVK